MNTSNLSSLSTNNELGETQLSETLNWQQREDDPIENVTYLFILKYFTGFR